MWFQDMVPLICCHHTMITTNIRRADTDEGKDKSDTTIYEVDLACYESLTPEEKRKYFPQTWEEERRLHQRNSSNLMNRK